MNLLGCFKVDALDALVVHALTEDYKACYEETDNDGELVRDPDIMPQLKDVIEYYTSTAQQKEFNKRFPL